MLPSSPPSSLAPSSRPAPDADLIAGFYAAAAHAQDYSGPWSALCTAFKADTGLLYRQSRPAASPDILAAQNWPRLEHGMQTAHGRDRHTAAIIRFPGQAAAASFPSLAAFDATEQPRRGRCTCFAPPCNWTAPR